MEKLISTKEAARLTGYTQTRIRHFAEEGILKFYRATPKANIKFKTSELANFMNSGLKK